MSINVTVSGNPVSIKRGKMVTSDPYNNKKEFDKRRLLRLEQVRQQSKELAEDVRNKVRKEKRKQMGDIEKEGKEQLKSWQNRKLLEIQNQYRDALDEIGVGHKEAEHFENESEILAEERLKNKEVAQNRGRRAETKLQVQKNEENYKKAMPIQHKKLVQDIENTRAALVSCIKKKGKCQNRAKKRSKADINITIPDDSDFDENSSEESSPHLPSIQEENSAESIGFCECSECSDEKESSETPPDTASVVNKFAQENNHSGLIDPKAEKNKQRVESNSLKSPSKICPDLQEKDLNQKSYQESIDERRKLIEQFRNRPKVIPLDTRISDRIKHRQHIAGQPDFCDEVCDSPPIRHVQERNRFREKIVPCPDYFGTGNEVRNKDPLELSDECICSKFHAICPCKLTSTGVQTDLSLRDKKSKCSCAYLKECKQSKESTNFIPQQKDSKSTEKGYRPDIGSSQRISSKIVGSSTEIPSKPSVKLKEAREPVNLGTQQSTAPSGAYKVRHYDFPNRFETEIQSTSHVERIGADSLEVIPNSDSEAEWHEKMKQRDREAQMRGKKALEKERIQKDYEDMMKKLPILQRKEHIARIGLDKPEYHMSEERLKQREKERQNQLENAYARAIPELKPQIITIPSRKYEVPKPDEPFEILDGDDSRTLNLGKWDIETKPKKMFSAEEVQEIIKAFTVQKPEDRKTKLKQLLKSLKLQKEQLLNEIQSLPKDDSINALISDLNSFSDSDEKLRKEKTGRHEKRDKHKDKEKGEKRTLEDSDTSNTSSDAVIDDKKAKVKDHHRTKHGKSPSKKMRKSRPKVLVLQNSSTQTTPKTSQEKKSSTSSSSSEQPNDPRKFVPASGLADHIKTCTKSHVPCDCIKEKKTQSSEEVCKIVIKLNEDESPKVEVMRSAKDKGQHSKMAEVLDTQRDRSPKSMGVKSPGKENKLPKSTEREGRAPKASRKQVETKSVATETDIFKQPLPKEPKKRKPTTQLGSASEKSSIRKRDESWKEHLSKNSMSTSSTSYFSPPDFSRPNTTASTEAGKTSLYNLRKKPQQTNVDGSSNLATSTLRSFDQSAPIQDQKLLNYIKRLLSMSKVSVEELDVSSSEVQTPNQSVIEMESNNPMATLHNIIKFINLRAADLTNELSISPDVTPVPPNSVATASDGSGFQTQPDESQHLPEKDTNGSSSDKTNDLISSRYADVTDSCSKRIANLAAMIQQLREEKIQMLQSPPTAPVPLSRDQEGSYYPPKTNQVVTPEYSDRDNSTRYLDFPPSSEKSKGTNSTASMDEEELNRRLLEIDMSLAEKLKRFSQQREDKSADSSDKSDKSGHGRSLQQPEDHPDQADQEFVNRLQRLMDENYQQEQLAQIQPPRSSKPIQSANVPFIPLLVDIPKLPILEPQPEDHTLDYPAYSEKRHPPPSKGLIAAKRHNGNISLMPHELSTIIEANSNMSTRVSPNNSCVGVCASPTKDTNAPLSPTIEEVSLPTDKLDEVANTQSSSSCSGHKYDSGEKSLAKYPKAVRSTTDKHSEEPIRSLDNLDFSTQSIFCNDSTCTSLLSTVSSKQSSSSSSNDKEIESMLRSIGMDWAIPTLQKTQKALALTSTSSSSNLTGQNKSKNTSKSSSELSLKDFLKKQLSGKISSSSLNKSDASPASFLRECSEISAIQANSSAEKERQKTSTPLLNTNKSNEEQQLFPCGSDISSIKNCSREALPATTKESANPVKLTFHTLGSDEQLSSESLVGFSCT